MRAAWVIPLLGVLVFSGCLDVIFNNPNGGISATVDCNTFSDLASKDSCFADRAVKELNVSLCESVSPTNHDLCVGTVADAKAHGVTCFSMTSFSAQIP